MIRQERETNLVTDHTTDDYQVTALEWERIFLKFTVETARDEEVSFGLRHFNRKRRRPKKGERYSQIIDMPVFGEVPIKPESVERADGKTKYHFVLNITAVDGNAFLDNGKWQVQANVPGEEPFTCSVSYDLAYLLDDKSRIYKYDDGKYAYNISFGTYSVDGKTLSLMISSYFLIENDDWQRRRYVQEATTLRGKFDRMHQYAVIEGMRAYYAIVEKLSPKKGDKIMFMTETKPYLWGNLKYIDDRMKARGLDKEFKVTYSLRNAVGTHKSALSWAGLITKIAKQDYIFVDDYVPVFGFLELADRTKLIQVWHAGEGFKAVGYCRFGKAGTPFPVGSCHKQYDYAITGSERLVHVYSEVFGLPEENFLPVGMARLDGFLDPDKIAAFRKEFYAEYPQFEGKKIILFAPTFRGTGQKVAFYEYERLDMKRIYDFCGDEYVWVFKMHPFVTDKPPIPKEYSDRIFDLSSFENINDLYYVTEIMITDYSSAYFEFALMEKPVLFFTYDRECYELTRGVHKSVKDDAPGKVCDSFDELMEALENKDYDYEKTEAFREANFSNYDGQAADKIIDTILLGK